MSSVTIPYRYKVRGGTAAAVAALNEIPLARELVFETDTGKYKIGDGVTAWNSLGYHDTDSVPEGANLYHTDERVLDAMGAALVAGANVTITPDDVANTITIAASTGGGGGGEWTTVKKTADEARASSATLIADSDLSFACAAGTRYRVRIAPVYVGANATMGLQFDLNYTGTLASGYAHRAQHNPNATLGTGGESTAVSSGFISGGSGTMLTTVGGMGTVHLDLIINTTTAGTFSFRWAQNVSNAGDLTVLAGSYLEYMAC